ncbi:MAG: LCP family protein [Oscillospiraceae bacterium]|nr:LCP family protein [Oscillospiraceae bacterium]
MTGRRVQQPMYRRRRANPLVRFIKGVYRVAVIISALIVAGFLLWKLFVPTPKAPPIPDNVGDSSYTEDVPGGLERRDLCYTFLLMGTDDGNGNADTLMVATYDVANQKVGVVSIPRDTIVDRTWSRYPKINGAYSGGNIDRVRQEVSHLLGIPIDYFIKVDIKAFVELVDAVDGVDFDVPVDMDYDDPWQDLSIHYKKGLQHLDGQQALEVVRFRHNNDMTGYSDTGRTNTQQALIRAVLDKVLSWGSIGRIKPLLDVCMDNVQTDLTAAEVLYFAGQALYLDVDSGIETVTLPGRGDATHNGYKWCVELDREKSMQIINDLLNPYKTPVTDEMAHIVKANG